jgi:hypothetical protein
VDLQADQSIFDWCDLTSYSRAGVEGILNYHNINSTMIDQGLRWVALNPAEAYCDDFDSSDLLANYILSWEALLAPFEQQTGCIGALSGAYFPYIQIYAAFPGVDMSTGDVTSDLFSSDLSGKYAYLQRAIVGTHLEVFGGYIDWSDWDPLVEAMGHFRERNETFMVTSMEDDPDTINGGYVDPSYPFYYFHRIFVGLSCALCVGAIIHNVGVIRIYFKSDKKGFNYSLVTLLLSLIGSIVRFMCLLDPYGLMGVVDFPTYVLSVSISDSCHVAASLSSMLVWFDMIYGVQSSMAMVYRPAIYTKSIPVRVLLFLIITILAVFDLYATCITNLIDDPWGFDDWSYTVFEDRDSEGISLDNTGVYTSSYLTFIRLISLAVLEMYVAARVWHEVRAIFKDLNKVKPETGTVEGSGAGAVGIEGGKKAGTKASREEREMSRDGTSTAREPAAGTPSEVTQRKGPVLNEYKMKIMKKLSRLSKFMVISGVLMVASSIALLFEGLGDTWVLGKKNPYLFNFLFLFPFVLLQISSSMEVTLVQEVLMKV